MYERWLGTLTSTYKRSKELVEVLLKLFTWLQSWTAYENLLSSQLPEFFTLDFSKRILAFVSSNTFLLFFSIGDGFKCFSAAVTTHKFKGNKCRYYRTYIWGHSQTIYRLKNMTLQDHSNNQVAFKLTKIWSSYAS